MPPSVLREQLSHDVDGLVLSLAGQVIQRVVAIEDLPDEAFRQLWEFGA